MIKIYKKEHPRKSKKQKKETKQRKSRQKANKIRLKLFINQNQKECQKVRAKQNRRKPPQIEN